MYITEKFIKMSASVIEAKISIDMFEKNTFFAIFITFAIDNISVVAKPTSIKVKLIKLPNFTTSRLKHRYLTKFFVYAKGKRIVTFHSK